MEKTITPPPKDSSLSYDNKTLIVILLLIFCYPAGLIMMWIWMKWPLWVRILLTVIPCIGAILVAGFVASLLVFIFSRPDVQKEIKTSSNVQMEIPQAPMQDTSDWKTYANSNNDYSFLYPQDWNTSVNTSSGEVVAGPFTQQDLQKLQQGPYNGNVVLRMYTLLKGYEPEIARANTDKTLSKNTVIVGGKPAISYHQEVMSIGDPTNGVSLYNKGTEYTMLLVPNGNSYIVIEHVDGVMEDIYNQVISSFKFTK